MAAVVGRRRTRWANGQRWRKEDDVRAVVAVGRGSGGRGEPRAAAVGRRRRTLCGGSRSARRWREEEEQTGSGGRGGRWALSR
jgi:hypothetical protein